MRRQRECVGFFVPFNFNLRNVNLRSSQAEEGGGAGAGERLRRAKRVARKYYRSEASRKEIQSLTRHAPSQQDRGFGGGFEDGFFDYRGNGFGPREGSNVQCAQM